MRNANKITLLTSLPISALTLVCTSLLLSACGGGGSSSSAGAGDEPLQFKGMLKPVQNDAEFLAALESAYTSSDDQQNRDALFAQPAAEGDFTAGAPADNSGDPGSAYSTTYTLEENVDEVDVVKYDGEHLFIAPSMQYACCYILASPAMAEDSTDAGTDASTGDIAPPPQAAEPPSIRVLATDTSDASAAEVARIELGEGEYVQGLYLLNEQQGLLSLMTQNFYGGYGGMWLDFAPWYQQNMTIQYYDISNASQPEKQWSVSLEGGFVESRRVGNTVYLVSRHTPQVDGLYLYPADSQQFSENRNTIRQSNAEDFIPTLTIDNGDEHLERPLFSASDCLVTNKDVVADDNAGYRVLTSITAVSLNDPLNPQTVCYNESAAGMYMSSEALYLTDVRYRDTASVTRIHKFALDGNNGGKPVYRGSAEVAGYLWAGGQNDFRISERNGVLRLLTTERTDNENDRWDHHLYLLEENAASQSLQIVGQLPNGSRPQPIGKDNEDIYGVRFIDTRAYVVSFERIDPLYVLDLSSPADPKITGTLEVPGFSDFLHPIGDDLLLGLGASEQWGGKVKLELFDVSDPANPSSKSSVLIGDDKETSWSEAQYNRHAFTYLNGALSDRLAVPAQISRSEGGYSYREALYLFELNNKQSPAAASLDAVGSIDASWPENQNWYGGYRHRSVIDGDAVYFISGDYVWSALWDSPESVNPHQ